MKNQFPFLISVLTALSLASCNIGVSTQSTTSSSGSSSESTITTSKTQTSIPTSQSSDPTSKPTSTSGEAKKDFTGISFDNAEFNYDGQAHSIYVSGAPTFATVTYTNNNKIAVGSYTVTARVEASGYNTLVKSATMRIKGKSITGVTFEDKTFTYDGNAHSLEVTNLPTGVSASYSNNNKKESGTYTVTANLSGTGYEPLKLTAKLTINPVELEKSGIFNSKTFIYDGQNHSIEVLYCPSGLTISYKCLNASGTNTFKNPGFYEIEATVKLDNNHLSKKYATLVITTEATSSIDSSKTPLTIDENLKWDQLHVALAKNNFTSKYLSGSYDVEIIDDPMPEDLLNDSFEGHSIKTIFASDGKEAFQHSLSMDTTSSDYSYHYFKEYGNDIICLDSYDGGVSKFPKEAFYETVTNEVASNAFVGLTKGVNGEFLPGINGDSSYYDVGEAYIEDGVFTVLMKHSRPLSSGYRYFYEIYKFYNIGNTSVSVPSNYLPSQSYIENKIGIEDFYLDGVEYSHAYYGTATNIKIYYAAKLYIDYHHAIFLEKGNHTALPRIYSRVVEAIIYTDSSYAYNTNQSGYNFRLYVDSNGVYQGDYSSLGALAKFDIKEFIKNNGTVEYYDEWHN